MSTLGITCFQCVARGVDAAHPASECPLPKDASYEGAVQMLKTTITFDKFSGCFRCGIPQELCQSFRRTSKGIVMAGGNGNGCTYGKALFEAAGALLADIPRTRPMRERVWSQLGVAGAPGGRQDQHDGRNIKALQQSLIQRLGKKVRWQGWETNILFRTTVEWYIEQAVG